MWQEFQRQVDWFLWSLSAAGWVAEEGGRGGAKGKSVSREEKLEVQVWEFKNVVT